MKMTFRWYGKTDPVSLEYISQIPGMTGVVTAIYDIPVGEVWPLDKIMELKEEVNEKNLEMKVIESVPVHEDIKMGVPSREKYIENYKENIRNLAKAGVEVICYNFMPVFDWTRSNLDYKLPDGSTALVYYRDEIEKMDPRKGELSLPGWDASYKKEELNEILDKYKNISEEDLWNNLKYFLDQIIPVVEEVKVKMAIHPDDPPWPIFGLPRIITNEENIDRFLKLYDSEYNGLTLCTGSLGVAKDNNMPNMIRRFGKKIHFAHLRNIKIIDDRSFQESAHMSKYGSLDFVEILKAYKETGFTGYARPDHGRMIWGEKGRPGYGLYDRALGAVYLMGIWETLEKGC